MYMRSANPKVDASKSLPSKIVDPGSPLGVTLEEKNTPSDEPILFLVPGFVMSQVALGTILIWRHPHHLQSMPHSPLESLSWRSGHL